MTVRCLSQIVMLYRAHTFIWANNLINRICRLMFPLHENIFQLSWLVTSIVRAFAMLIPLKRGGE